jgi:hypothetical protein
VARVRRCAILEDKATSVRYSENLADFSGVHHRQSMGEENQIGARLPDYLDRVGGEC